MPAKQKQSDIGKQLAAFAWLQAIGTNIAALGQTKALSRRRKTQQEAQKLIILGNALQSIANAAQAELTAEQGSNSGNQQSNDLNVAGNLLQSIGNALQVIGSSQT